MSSSDISMPIAKAASAVTVTVAAQTSAPESIAQSLVQGANDGVWYVVMSVPWGTVASIFAASYSLILISEWWWKKLWRPLAESRGWIKPRKRYVLTEAEWDSMQDTDRGPL